jgi:hypothetical protein
VNSNQKPEGASGLKRMCAVCMLAGIAAAVAKRMTGSESLAVLSLILVVALCRALQSRQPAPQNDSGAQGQPGVLVGEKGE